MSTRLTMPTKLSAESDGQLVWQNRSRKDFAQARKRAFEVGVFPVHLVDENKARFADPV